MNTCESETGQGDGLILALKSGFHAWLTGIVVLPIVFVISEISNGFADPLKSMLALFGTALLVAFLSGFVLIFCIVCLVWPACAVACRYCPLPPIPACLLGALIGGLVGCSMVRDAGWIALIPSAYGAVIGISASITHRRWKRLP